MPPKLRDAEHLLRLMAVIAVCVGVFLLVRSAVVPQAFGQYGHYRPGALEDNRNRPRNYAGQADCAMCHEDQVKLKTAGRHKGVSCEACHGPQAAHAEDPSKRPVRPDAAQLCRTCHEKDAAKPAGFPQVAAASHYSEAGACNACHQPHSPKM